MKKILFYIVILALYGCNKPKTVFICGDHVCINKAEAQQYFEDNLSLEVRLIDKKKAKAIDLVELNLKPNQPLIGKIGVIRGWKGYDYLLEAAPIILKKYPDARFVFVGRGPGFEQTKSIANSLGLEKAVTLLGHREDIPEIMAGLDIQVLASFAGEGTPQVIPQAFAMKTPVVATRVGSVPEMLGQGERGILVELKNSVDLANGIIKLIENPDIGKEISERGYEFCKNELGIDRMIDETVATYEEALES